MKGNKGKVILSGALVVLCAVVGMIALGGSTVNSVAFDQVPVTREKIEVYGALDESSIRPIRGPHLVQFDLVEEKTGRRLGVVYENPQNALPANFPAASHARCSGVYDPAQQRFVADRVLTKCPSKYDEKNLEYGKQKAIDKWKSATGLKS